MTYMDNDNQNHLVRFADRSLIIKLISCLRLCAQRLPRHLAPSAYYSVSLNSSETNSATAATASLTAIGSDGQSSDVQSTNLAMPFSTANSGREQDALATSHVTSQTILPAQKPDQKILLDCLLGIFRLLVNVSQNG
ncbi:unnamed protein product [Protopolystoma xenopodis]|uniref:Uncharacterized protein n=1 Tax=Protopolystoma xenopodis TaxID=117903 RepID=A0A3S5B878_9PLAT|nr:unnamed protein product [Protopolystoma xenopodis]